MKKILALFCFCILFCTAYYGLYRYTRKPKVEFLEYRVEDIVELDDVLDYVS